MQNLGPGIAIAAFPLAFALAIYGAGLADAEYERGRSAAVVACAQAGGEFIYGWGKDYRCKLPEPKR